MQAGELGHCVLLAGRTLSVIGKRTVRAGEKCLGLLVLALDGEVELALAHGAADEGLADRDARIVGVGRPVGVDEGRSLDVTGGLVGVGGGLDVELPALVRNLHGHGVDVPVIGHAASRLVGRDLADLKDVGASLGERGGTKVERLGLRVRKVPNLNLRREARAAALGA